MGWIGTGTNVLYTYIREVKTRKNRRYEGEIREIIFGKEEKK